MSRGRSWITSSMLFGFFLYLVTLPISNKEALLTYLSYCASKGAVKAVILAFFAALVFVTRNIGSDASKFGRTSCKDKWGYLQSTGNDDHKTGREVKKLLPPSKLPDIPQNIVKMLSGAHDSRLHSVSIMEYYTVRLDKIKFEKHSFATRPLSYWIAGSR